jgi:hypothetical protein
MDIGADDLAVIAGLKGLGSIEMKDETARDHGLLFGDGVIRSQVGQDQGHLLKLGLIGTGQALEEMD